VQERNEAEKILREIMMAELATINQYTELACMTDNQEVKDLIAHIN
jgi:bacterioferritin (cytochrome b1)